MKLDTRSEQSIGTIKTSVLHLWNWRLENNMIGDSYSAVVCVQLSDSQLCCRCFAIVEAIATGRSDRHHRICLIIISLLLMSPNNSQETVFAKGLQLGGFLTALLHVIQINIKQPSLNSSQGFMATCFETNWMQHQDCLLSKSKLYNTSCIQTLTLVIEKDRHSGIWGLCKILMY